MPSDEKYHYMRHDRANFLNASRFLASSIISCIGRARTSLLYADMMALLVKFSLLMALRRYVLISFMVEKDRSQDAEVADSVSAILNKVMIVG